MYVLQMLRSCLEKKAFVIADCLQHKDVASHRANKACCSLTLIRLRSSTRPESVGLVRWESWVVMIELRVTLVTPGGLILLSLLDFALLMVTPGKTHLSLLVYVFISKSKQLDFRRKYQSLQGCKLRFNAMLYLLMCKCSYGPGLKKTAYIFIYIKYWVDPI